MPFPEILGKLKEFFSDSGAPISLNLKEAGVVFDSTLNGDAAAFYAKYPQIIAALGGGYSSWSGETVSRETALGSPTIYACNQVVAGTIGYIGATLMQVKNGQRREATEHPLYSLIKYEPNEEMSAQEFFETATSHCLLQGNAYAQIIRRSGVGTAIELRLLNPDGVRPDREKTGQKRLFYTVTETGQSDKTYFVERGRLHDIFHLRGIGWDGIRGYSVLQMDRHSIGMAIAADRNVSSFWRNGGRTPYGIEFPKRFESIEKAKKYRSDLMELMRQPNEPPIFDDGSKVVKMAQTMQEAQAIEFRQALIAELCRPFDVQPHLVGDLSRATFNNIEELALQFEKLTLAKWNERWRQQFRRCVLTPEEKEQGYYLHQNLDKLRRGDFQKRMFGYASALQNGHMTIDEVRALEERNPYPDGIGSHPHIQTNMGTVGPDGQIIQAGGLIRLDADSQKGESLQ